MDPMISLGQKNTLAEYMILSGADNRPPMLDKDLYDSWKSRMELYMQNIEHGRMILESVEHGPLIWPTVEENDAIKTKKYAELSAKKIQADCERECKLCDAFDKFTHIKGESLHMYHLRFTQLTNDMNIYKINMEQFQVNTKFLNSLPPEWSFTVLVFSPGDDPTAYLNKTMAFLTVVASSREDKGKIILVILIRAMLLVQGEILQVDMHELLNATTAKVKDIWLGNALSQSDQGMQHDPRIPASQTQTVIPHNAAFQTEDLDTYDSDCDDLSSAQAVLMANISNYGSDVISEVPNSETYLNDMDNLSVHALHDFEQSPVMDFTNNDISSDSNIISYSQYLQETQQATIQAAHLQAQQDSMILSVIEQMFEQMINHVNNWEKANKEQNNESITAKLERYKERVKIFKQLGQSAQTVHMLTKPQAFYDNTHKQALGYQNPFYLRKAQWIKPTLYDGAVISKTHVDMPVIDDEETLILEEESRSKMFEKAKDPEVIAKKISHKPIDYEKLNSLIEDFETRQSGSSSELPKVSLVNASLKKLKFHLTQFDSVVKKRTTPSALEEGVALAPVAVIMRLYVMWYAPWLCVQLESFMWYTPWLCVQLEAFMWYAPWLCVQLELLVYVQDTCPNAIPPSAKKVTVKPMNNVKKVRFVEPLTSSSKIQQVESSNTSYSNTPMLSSTRVKCSTSNCGSKPPGNKKNDMISQPPSKNKKNKVEAQPRKVNKRNRVVKPVCDVDVKHSLSHTNSDIICATCNKSMFDGVHDKCFLNLVQNGNKRSKSAKKHKKRNIWKPSGHVLSDVGFKWKPTGRIFIIVVQIVLWYLDSGCSKHMIGNCSQLMNFVSKLQGTVRFRNDQILRIMGYGDYQLGKIIISRVYYVEGLGHNLFSIGQFCDTDLEVAFWKNTCFIRNLEGVDLLSGS
ncbi:hypothetical protein Tco_0012778 [Tanacetum coccineum]